MMFKIQDLPFLQMTSRIVSAAAAVEETLHNVIANGQVSQDLRRRGYALLRDLGRDDKVLTIRIDDIHRIAEALRNTEKAGTGVEIIFDDHDLTGFYERQVMDEGARLAIGARRDLEALSVALREMHKQSRTERLTGSLTN